MGFLFRLVPGAREEMRLEMIRRNETGRLNMKLVRFPFPAPPQSRMVSFDPYEIEKTVDTESGPVRAHIVIKIIAAAQCVPAFVHSLPKQKHHKSSRASPPRSSTFETRNSNFNSSASVFEHSTKMN